MQRNVNESFEAYKVRRSDANKALGFINYAATHGGTVGARKQLRHARNSQRLRGVGLTRAVGTKRSVRAIANSMSSSQARLTSMVTAAQQPPSH